MLESMSYSVSTNSSRVYIGHDQEYSSMFCVTDPHLWTVDDVIVFLFLCFSLQRESVTAWLRLWQAKAADLSTKTYKVTIARKKTHSHLRWWSQRTARAPCRWRVEGDIAPSAPLCPGLPAGCLWACSECHTARPQTGQLSPAPRSPGWTRRRWNPCRRTLFRSLCPLTAEHNGEAREVRKENGREFASWRRILTPCSNRELITSASIAEFSSILDTIGAMRSWENFFTDKEKKHQCFRLYSENMFDWQCDVYLRLSSWPPPVSSSAVEENLRRSHICVCVNTRVSQLHASDSPACPPAHNTTHTNHC